MTNRITGTLRNLAAAIAALALIGFASAQGDVEAVWGIEQGFVSLDPADRGSAPDAHFELLIFDQLVQRPDHFNPDGTVPDWVPGLAESWTVSDDGLVWTFALRQGVQFHKGYGQFTAEDVKFTFDRMADPANAFPRRGEFDMVREIVVLDDYTVEFHLDAPFAPFLHFLALQEGAKIVSKRAVEEMGNAAFSLNPIGTGPYVFVSAEPGGAVEVEANDDYWRGRPEVDRARLAVIPDQSVQALALLRGEIDWMRVRDSTVYRSLLGQPGVNIVRHPEAAFQNWEVWLNTTRGPLGDKRVRHAMLHALDREALVEAFIPDLSAGVAYTFVRPSHIGQLPPEELPAYEYDPERARELLAEAGYGDGFNISTVAINQAFMLDMLTAMQEYWGEVGIDLTIDTLEIAAWNARLQSGDYDMWVGSSGRSEVDQVLFNYHSGNPPSVRGNYSYYENARVDELIELQRATVDIGARVEMIHELQRIIMDDLVVLPIVYIQDVTAVSDKFASVPDNMFTWYFKVDRFTLHD